MNTADLASLFDCEGDFVLNPVRVVSFEAKNTSRHISQWRVLLGKLLRRSNSVIKRFLDVSVRLGIVQADI